MLYIAVPGADLPFAGKLWVTSTRDLLRVEHPTGCHNTNVVLPALTPAALRTPSTRMQSESRDPTPGSSLNTPVAHTTATHNHRSPMRRFMNGLKRLNSYSSEKSDSSSSEDNEHHNDGQDGSEEFLERHRVQEIRFNYEGWPLHIPWFPHFQRDYQVCVLESSFFSPSPNVSSSSVHPPIEPAHNSTISRRRFSSTTPSYTSQESWSSLSGTLPTAQTRSISSVLPGESPYLFSRKFTSSSIT